MPFQISESKVRQVFGEKGQLTDVQLKYTPDGTFRQFAFIGYQNDEDASTAIQYFNNYYLESSKLSVERCSDLGKT